MDPKPMRMRSPTGDIHYWLWYFSLRIGKNLLYEQERNPLVSPSRGARFRRRPDCSAAGLRRRWIIQLTEPAASATTAGSGYHGPDSSGRSDGHGSQ
jgi:hypothetical protein